MMMKMMMETRMNKKTNFPDLERLPNTNFWEHLLNYWWNRPRILFEDIHEKYILKPKEEKVKIELDRIINETELLNKMIKLELELSKIKKNSTK